MYRITESPTHATFTLQKVRRKSSFAEIGVDYTLLLFYALLAILKKIRKSNGRISKIFPQKCKELA
jgi:hypothetical protein